MANPQVENGYTRIANEIMEALAGIRISGEARQILDVIFRKTYGYGKKEDSISLSQFYLLTKMPKPRICHAINKLIKMNIIAKKGNDIANVYRFNKDFDTWKSLPKKVMIAKKGNDDCQKRQESLPKIGHTIEKKENTTKDNNASPDRDIEKMIQEKGSINHDFQYFGLEIFEKTNAPPDKKSECMRLAKQYPTLITPALSFSIDYPNKNLKWKMFLWKINELIKNKKNEKT